MKNNVHSAPGFTLVELLIVIGLIAILSSIGMLGISSFNRKQTFSSAVNEVYSQILLAKSKTQTQIVPDDTCTPLTGYRIIFSTDTYGVVAVCNGTPQLLDAANAKKLPPGYKFTGLSGVTFKVLYGTTNAAVNGSKINITGPSSTRSLTVYQDGRVKID